MSPLNIIYHFQVSQSFQEEFRPASYKIIHLFSVDSFLEESYLNEKYEQFPDMNHEGKSFLNLDDLKNFSLMLAEDLEVEEARLISIQDYNIGVDGARNANEFKGIFSHFGEVIKNPKMKKKGLLGRLFS